MAKNNLTPEQDLLCREFFQKVASQKSLFPSDPVGQRNLLTTLFRLLGYDKPTVTSYRFGQPSVTDITAEWEQDAARAQEAFDEANKSASSNEADSSESGTSTEVRTSVLPEDVQ